MASCAVATYPLPPAGLVSEAAPRFFQTDDPIHTVALGTVRYPN